MDYKKEILREHSKRQCLRIVEDALLAKANFKKLIDAYLAGPYRVTQRAAWPISVCVEHQPEIILPHLSTVLSVLKNKNIHPAVKRNTLRLLQYIDIPTRLQGKVTTLCFGYLHDATEPVAIHVFAMTVLAKLTRQHPELRKELSILIEDKMDYSSAAFRSRGSKILKEMNE